MSESTLPLPGLSPVGGKRVVARFDGGEMSSDGGVLLLREVDRRLGIADRLARCIIERRGPARVRHAMADILRFLILMIVAAVAVIDVISHHLRSRLINAGRDLPPSLTIRLWRRLSSLRRAD